MCKIFLKCSLPLAFSKCVYCLLMRFQRNWVGWLKPLKTQTHAVNADWKHNFSKTIYLCNEGQLQWIGDPPGLHNDWLPWSISSPLELSNPISGSRPQNFPEPRLGILLENQIASNNFYRNENSKKLEHFTVQNYLLNSLKLISF